MAIAPTGATLTWTRRGETFNYAVTPADVLTLARAVAHEGAPQVEVAWALIQRFGHVYKHGFNTLKGLVQAYAQPINPRWFPNGDKYLQEIARIERGTLRPDQKMRAIAVENARAERRTRYAVQSWAALPDRSKAVVASVLGGHSQSQYPMTVHYRASKARRGDSDSEARAAADRFAAGRSDLDVIDVGAGFKRGVNWFFTSPNFRNTEVVVGPQGPLVGKGCCPSCCCLHSRGTPGDDDE